MDSITIVNPFDKLGFSSGMEKLAPDFTFEMDKVASMVKAGDYKLPEDPAQWNAAIQDAIQSQHPDVIKAGSNPHIIYKHSDWGSGCALGSISVAVGKSLIVFPIVIRYGNLAPFDMVYDHSEDKWMHTSEESMRTFASGDESLFGSVTNKKVTGDNEYDDRWEYLRSPRGNDFKGASLVFADEDSMAHCPLDALEGAMKYAESNSDRLYYSPDYVMSMFKKASKAAELSIKALFSSDQGKALWVKMSMAKSGTEGFEEPSIEQEILTKEFDNVKDSVSDLTPSGKVREAREATEELPEEIEEEIDTPYFQKAAYDFFNMAFIKKTGLGQYDLSLGRRGYKGAFLVSGGIDKMASALYGETSEEAMKQASKILDAVDEAEGLLLDTAEDDADDIHSEILGDVNVVDDSKRVTRYGIYEVFTESGQKQTGHVIPVFDWNGEKSQAFLFISECSWALQSNINGRASGRHAVLPNGVIRPERRGALVYDSDGRGIALPPVEIKSVHLKKTGTTFRGVDLGSMKPVNIVMSKDAPGVMEFSEFNDPEAWIPGHINVYVPIGAKFVPLPEEVTKIASAEGMIKKLELKLATAADSCIEVKKQGGLYYLSDEPDMFDYPESMKQVLKSASYSVHDKKKGLGAKEAEFVLRRSGGMMADITLPLIKEGKSFSIPVENANDMKGMHESLIKAAQLTHEFEIPARYKSAAEHLRLDIDQVLSVVTLAPHLKTAASVILPEILNKEDIYHESFQIEKRAGHLKGAEYDDKPTLDDLFELGFLNDKNLRHFVSKQQDIIELEDFLCKVLMATRIAGFGMEEDNAQNALYGVSDLKNVLARINFKIHGSD